MKVLRVPAPTTADALDEASPRRGRRLGWSRLVTAIARRPFEVTVGLMTAAYVALALSPSSYGLVLRELRSPAGGSPYLGTPRLERWDEWAVQTPYVQAVVRNGFGDRNLTSFYGESFRNLVSLPVMDWGFALRPLHWGYAVLPPAWGFSLFWGLCAFLTVVGWHVLLRRLGTRYILAATASLAIFLSPFVQSWWTGLAPLLALFPWIMLCVASGGHLAWRAPLLAWLVGSWVVSAAYLPGLVLLAFLGVALVLAFVLERRTALPIAVLGVAALAGGAVGVAYLWPVLMTLANTVYPGARVVPGGGLPLAQWLAQFSPLATTQGYTPLLPQRLPEAVALGSFLPLLAVATVDYGRVRREHGVRDLRPLIVLGVSFLLVTAWQLLPVAGPLGAVLGWNRGEVQRSLMISGPLLIIMSVWVMSRLPLRLGPRRVLVLAGIVAGTVLLGAALLPAGAVPPGATPLRDSAVAGAIAVAMVAMVAVLGRFRARTAWAGLAALAIVVPSAGFWSAYNPVQDSRALFRPIDTPATRVLDVLAERRPDGLVDVPSAGAVVSGLGYRTPFTALPLPQLDTFRALYPELSDAELNQIFNRYVELGATDGPRPILVGDGAALLPRDVLRRVDEARERGHPVGLPRQGR